MFTITSTETVDGGTVVPAMTRHTSTSLLVANTGRGFPDHTPKNIVEDTFYFFVFFLEITSFKDFRRMI